MNNLILNPKGDELLTSFSKKTLEDRYLLEGESYQELFARVALAYSDNRDHAQRIYDYMSNLWYMPATPILTNAGQPSGQPISCFLNQVEDNMTSIVRKLFTENIYLSQGGGGIGTSWSAVRSIGEPVGARGKSSGIIPFLHCQNAQSLAISQGLLRRGSSAAYLHISHPEIEEFMDIRRPVGGDHNRKALDLHHGVILSDAFLNAVKAGDEWKLISPKTGLTVRTIQARDLWIKLLTARIETGEPYILFESALINGRSETYKRNGSQVTTSNLCSEITLTTGLDYNERVRTAVCCLSSLNLEYYEEWKNDGRFISDIMRFLDNVLSSFIRSSKEEISDAAYSAYMERSVGLGVMGFHTYLQSKNIPFESPMAKTLNLEIFSHIRKQADRASNLIAMEKGPCPDALRAGLMERFAHKIAVAPTASISIIAGNTSPGIEPTSSNASTHKTLSGSYNVKNKVLEKVLESYGQNSQAIWTSIMKNEGSVQHLDFLSGWEKDVFKTAFELNQQWLIDHAADRQPFICQAQSLNLFLPATISKKLLSDLHLRAWEKGLKSLYYCRSKSINKVDSEVLDCISCQ